MYRLSNGYKNIYVSVIRTSNHQLDITCRKILLYIIKNRITKIINEHLEESQFGFREGSGTRNAIYVLRTIGERMMQKKRRKCTFASSIMQRHLIM